MIQQVEQKTVQSQIGPCGPHYGPWRLDPADPISWSCRRLRYSDHALERIASRSIPEQPYLPATSRLADLDVTDERVEAMLFKVTECDDPFFLVLSTDGCVITVFRKGKEWESWRAAKQYRRSMMVAV